MWDLVALSVAGDYALWLPSVRDGAPNTIFGWPYEVDNAIEVGAGNFVAYFGNFSYYGLRTVGSIDMFRLVDSRTLQSNQMEVLAFSRRDGRPMGAGAADKTNAIKALTSA